MEGAKKEGRYQRLIKQLEVQLKRSNDPIARMATVSAVLYHKMDYFFWCGFYRMVEGELIVGPYQGPLACQILTGNKGVCWSAVNKKRTIIVPDVHLFPDHIACDSRSASEIVIPVFNNKGEILAVLDVDSKTRNSFDEAIDGKYLEKIVALLDLK